VYGNYSELVAEGEARGTVIYGGRVPRAVDRACRACGHMWLELPGARARAGERNDRCRSRLERSDGHVGSSGIEEAEDGAALAGAPRGSGGAWTTA
jgi:hypothetical protein